MKLSKLNRLILHCLMMILICQFATGNCARKREEEESHETNPEGGHETNPEGGHETNPEGGHEASTEEDPYKPFKVHEKMAVCSEYQDNSCCSAEGAEFLEKYIFPGYEGLFDDCHSCVDAWIKVMCTTTCSPHQSEFLEIDEKEAYLYICPDLCQQLYRACGSETLYPPKKVRVRYAFPEPKEFCESGLIKMDAGFGLIRIKVAESRMEGEHNISGCLSESMLEAENPFVVKPYCIAHHAAHKKAIELVIFMIPFVIGVLLANYFHHIHLSFIPESGVLIILGAIYGLLMINFGGDDAKTSLAYDKTVFTVFLLPPIIFESGYSLRQKRFMANMDAILFYAVVGTVVAWLVIGPGLYLTQDLFDSGLQGTMAEWLTFSALISAVDPVATLATFSSLGVEEDLAMIIFGEALINDAVAIVLFNTCKAFVESPADASIGAAVGNLLQVSLGSPLLGAAIGLGSAMVFKVFNFGYDNFFLETAVFITLTWASFLVAEASGLSGIISSLVCGLVCEHYTYRNLTKGGRELTLLWYKQWSTVCDMLVFYMMGMMVVVSYGALTFRFTLICFGLILLGRMFSVFPLTCLINSWRFKWRKSRRQISWQYQIVIWFSGLRGAIAVTLALDLPTELRDALTAATVVVAIATVFVFGGTTSMMLKCLKIKMGLEEREKTMKPHGIAEVQEMKGWKYIDNKYMKPCFIRDRNLRYPEFDDGPQAHLDNMMFQLHKEEIEKSKIEMDDDLGGSILQVVKSTVGSIFNKDLEEASKFQSINKDTLGVDMNDLGRSRGATRTRGTTNNRGSTQGEGKVHNFSRTMFAASPPAN